MAPCAIIHTATNFVASIILLHSMHLVSLHMMNHFSRAAGDILSYLLSSKRYLTIISINYMMLLFVHVSGVSRGRDETCLYDHVQTSLSASIRWMSITPFQPLRS